MPTAGAGRRQSRSRNIADEDTINEEAGITEEEHLRSREARSTGSIFGLFVNGTVELFLGGCEFTEMYLISGLLFFNFWTFILSFFCFFLFRSY